MPEFEIRRERIDVTPSVLGAPLAPHRSFDPGFEHYYIDGVEVPREEFIARRQPELLRDIGERARELQRQLLERARLYRLLNATEIADEFERLSRAEVDPIIALAEADSKL